VTVILIAAMVIFALGYQLHFGINSEPFYLRFAPRGELQWLMPVFWIGFNIAMFPASIIVKHRGALIVMGAAGLLGGAAIYAAEIAGGLNTLIVAQFLAGAAWGCMLMSAISAALAIGQTGSEGKVTGLLFSALAGATPRNDGCQALAGWMNVHGVVSESFGTSIATRYGPPCASAFSSAGRK
jgi:hypothetical protein